MKLSFKGETNIFFLQKVFKRDKGITKIVLTFFEKLPVVMTENFYETLDGDLETLHKSGPRSVISTTQNTDN